MARHQTEYGYLTRRTFLRTMSLGSAVLLPAPFQRFSALHLAEVLSQSSGAFPPSNFRVTPHYPDRSPLDDVLRLVAPGLDEYVTEKYAFEMQELLSRWSNALKASPPSLLPAAEFLSSSIAACSLVPTNERMVRSDGAVEVVRRNFAPTALSGRNRFLDELKTYFSPLATVETAEFQIVAIEQGPIDSAPVKADIRYDLVGIRRDGIREERIGIWQTQWTRSDASAWQITQWQATEETVVRARDRLFHDITAQAFGRVESYEKQMLHGADYWRTVLDGACGIDVYGNNGLAVGDIDNDGFDDLYVCQPPGLPNRLYRNLGDGTFEDVTEGSGLGLLDGTACALFADFENKGLQDLLVVCAGGPQLFLNRGNGKFQIKRDAFKFAQPPQGTFTHAALADYDNDGRLDIYFCLYSYYLGLDQYHYPAPYFDARNGPPNFLMHNEGNATFVDRTEAAGLNAENDRYSFACAWGDYTGDGRASLYVANDFGRNNLYRNNGNGTFTAVSTEAQVNDVGAGMSATWLDFDNDGKQDIYAADMWSAAGMRVSQQAKFHEKDSAETRSLYRQHASGNTLYRNLGNGKFQNVSVQAGVDMGRWAWCSDAWDFDHDGYSDLYIANGYVSGADSNDLGSFFWRQVVGKSPSTSTPSPNYEHGWNAINELIRSDSSWSGYERNVLFLNNRDGTFSEISGAAGLDFPDDSRSFALADLDHDGRLEVILKNRNAPQLRVLHNSMKQIGNSISFRLRGEKSNRDAIGASITVEVEDHRQTKYLQAGSGFLAQHTKELFFGLGNTELGNTEKDIRATIRWPSGLTQVFEHLPANHRIAIQESSENFQATPFAALPNAWTHDADAIRQEVLPSSVQTWLIQPLIAPNFSLADLSGNLRDLQSLRGSSPSRSFVLLVFWTTTAPDALDQLQQLRQHWAAINASGLRVVGINVDDPLDRARVRSFASTEKLPFPNLLATQEVTGIYNIVYRYLFDRRRDLPIPASFLIDAEGKIVKLYQGSVNPQEILNDCKSAPKIEADRIRKALPFPGQMPDGGFQRNDFTYGVALFQRGYLDQAAASFQQVLATKPDSSEAYYNLGTLCLRTNKLPEARDYLEQAVRLRPAYPEAWNNLGMIAAESGQPEDAIDHFKHSLTLRPNYTVALVNLANLYRSHGKSDDAEKLLNAALAIEPDDPEANYSIGMLYARQDDLQRALPYLQKAVSVRPDYPEAINNIGVLFVRAQRYTEAEDEFKSCIHVAPNFDEAYINLARVYVILKDDQKAKEVLQQLLRLQPGHKMAQEALKMLN
jgi:tetratricopeptide (TPR) repeat protein